MKMEDNNKRVTIDMTYKDAEILSADLLDMIMTCCESDYRKKNKKYLKVVQLFRLLDKYVNE